MLVTPCLACKKVAANTSGCMADRVQAYQREGGDINSRDNLVALGRTKYMRETTRSARSQV